MNVGIYVILFIICLTGVVAEGGGGGYASVIVEVEEINPEVDEKETIVVPARTILQILGVIAFIGLLLFGWWITQPTNK